MSIKKVNLKKTEAVEWELEIEAGSNTITATLAYTDEYEGWVARCPNLGSPHPDFPALRLKKIKPIREEGGIVRVRLGFEANDPEAQYPGRNPGKVERYSMDLSSTEEPLLTNEMFKDLPDDEAEALQELLQSARSKDDFTKASGAVSSGQGVKAIEKIRKGREAYLNPGMVWVERFTTKTLSDLDISSILTTTNSPPGPCPSAGSQRNWLYLGGTANPNDDGETWEVEKRWQLSEKGKWDSDLYS